MNNKGYRCMKCEGKNVSSHGRYCPEVKKDSSESLKIMEANQ